MEFKNINILRGIAALAVVYFHLTGSAGLSKEVASTGQYGYLGVEMFFVISGFILPYSMFERGYNVSLFFVFMSKRLVRIYPSYIVMIIFAIVLMVLTKRPTPNFLSISDHLLFLNDLLRVSWISPVFWTLALELQFYILIGVFYNLIAAKNNLIALIFIVVMLTLSLISPASLLPLWFGMFAMGIILFRKICLKMSSLWFWTLTVLISIFIIYTNGLAQAITCLLTVLFILYIPLNNNSIFIQIGLSIGSISYSLYLTHWDFGRIGVKILRHIPLVGESEYFRLMIGIFLSLIAASIFYYFIERPSIKLSHRIKYNKTKDKTGTSAPIIKNLSVIK